jgi:Fe-S cluster biogenesis protein NfuA
VPEDVRGEGDRIAALLEEVRSMVGPSTWPRVEELVRRLVSLYGAGLRRVLELVAERGRLDAPLAERLAGDELVSSLLLLHGLHPSPVEERVARAADALRDRLGAEVTLVGVDAEGVVRVRVDAPGDARCGFSGAALARAVEQAIVEAAPEVRRVEVEGLAPPAAPERLVRLGSPPAGAGVSG